MVITGRSAPAPLLALAGLGLAAVTGAALGQTLWILVFAPLHRRSSQALLIATIGLAIALGLFLQRTKTGRIVRATAENRDMAEGLGVNASRIDWMAAAATSGG